MCTPLPSRAFRYEGSVATSVLPSPVRISAILPWCNAMPPTICTSKWRMPSVRFEASRTTANASGSTDSSGAPLATFCLSSGVFACRAASLRASRPFSSTLMVSTFLRYSFRRRSLRLPNTALRAFASTAGVPVRGLDKEVEARECETGPVRAGECSIIRDMGMGPRGATPARGPAALLRGRGLHHRVGVGAERQELVRVQGDALLAHL